MAGHKIGRSRYVDLRLADILSAIRTSTKEGHPSVWRNLQNQRRGRRLLVVPAAAGWTAWLPPDHDAGTDAAQ